jgi:hypothetical protein
MGQMPVQRDVAIDAGSVKICQPTIFGNSVNLDVDKEVSLAAFSG